MRTIGVMNQKGGCGKTTLAINLCGALTHLGRRVLLVVHVGVHDGALVFDLLVIVEHQPTGIVMAMRDKLYPHIVDKGINCGMRMVRTNVPASELTDERIDQLFLELQRRVPIKASKVGQLKKKEALRALLHGAEWARQKLFGQGVGVAEPEPAPAE